ncbi:hypothetical protein ACIPLC_38215, partial [Kitasatospora sp. NPDC086801]|uniref:hypothetical protein n=1 Tax=Kitasatospora sp. NPDC086801 TaxID=3364066 RepID=UPI0038294279
MTWSPMRTAAIPCTCRASEANSLTGPERSHSLDALTEFLTLLRREAGSPSFSTIVRRIGSIRAARGVPAEERTPGRITVYDCFRSGRQRLDVELLSTSSRPWVRARPSGAAPTAPPPTRRPSARPRGDRTRHPADRTASRFCPRDHERSQMASAATVTVPRKTYTRLSYL